MKSEWVNWSMPLYITWIKCSGGNDLCKVRALVVSTRSPTWSQTWQNINKLILHSFQLSMPNASYYYIWLVIWVEVSVSLWKTPSNYILNTKTNQPFLRFHSTWNNVKLPSKPQEKLLLHCKGRQTPLFMLDSSTKITVSLKCSNFLRRYLKHKDGEIVHWCLTWKRKWKSKLWCSILYEPKMFFLFKV